MTKQLYDALSCPKAYLLFTAEEGADGHCKGRAQVRFHRVAYDWLDKTLAPWAHDHTLRQANFKEHVYETVCKGSVRRRCLLARTRALESTQVASAFALCEYTEDRIKGASDTCSKIMPAGVDARHLHDRVDACVGDRMRWQPRGFGSR
jgi:hypothetical protein